MASFGKDKTMSGTETFCDECGSVCDVACRARSFEDTRRLHDARARTLVLPR